MEGKIKRRNKSFFTRAKKGTKFEEEKYEEQEKAYDFYCPKCRCKFIYNIYRYAVAVNSRLNVITTHSCGTRCHRFIKTDYDIVEILFLKSKKTPLYYPLQRKIKDAYKERGYQRRTKHLKKKDEFEV